MNDRSARRVSPRWRALALAVACLLGCARRSRTTEPSLDDATIALLSSARALHHEADLFEASGDLAAARGAVERVLGLPAPHAVRETEDVRVDAFGRLAELSLRAGDPARSIDRVAEGLREARRDSVLKARLHLVRGRALRALSESLQSRGDSAGASARRAEAIAALEASIQMNERVLRAALDGGAR
jgi:hypothetical protein